MKGFLFFSICSGFLLFSPLTIATVSAQNNIGIFFVAKTDKNAENSLTSPILEKPVFKAGDETFLRLTIPSLKTRWGQGYIRWNYTYYNQDRIKIWSSEVMTIRKESLLSSWTLQEDVLIVINRNISVGIYFIEVNIKDYYSKKKYSYRIRFEVESEKN